jgi:hypothetical protein
MRLTESERAELVALSRSASLRSDCKRVADTRHNPFIVDGEIRADRVVDFLTQYNEFLNHPIKPRTAFIEDNMKL